VRSSGGIQPTSPAVAAPVSKAEVRGLGISVTAGVFVGSLLAVYGDITGQESPARYNQEVAVNGGWWDNPEPDVNDHRCARCNFPASGHKGPVLLYPAGFFHAACADLEQEDDRKYREQGDPLGRKAWWV